MKREQLLRDLRKLAKETGKQFDVYEDRGKGSHYRVTFGDRFTTIKSGELTPGYVRLIRKQLGVD